MAKRTSEERKRELPEGTPKHGQGTGVDRDVSMQGGTPEPKNLAEMTAAPYNPRRMETRAMDGLRTCLRTFGDLSGFVWNVRTGHIVCGHQRRDALRGCDLSTIEWGARHEVELGRPGERFVSREREGWLSVPGGARFRIRRVDWPDTFEKAANVAANSPAICGVFTNDLDGLLEEIRKDMPELSSCLLLDDLKRELAGEDPSAPAADQTAQLPSQFMVLIECESEEQQVQLLERFGGEGLRCRALIS